MGSLPWGYYYLPIGQVEPVIPRTNESVEACYKRLRRLARHYLKSGRAFRVRIDGDRVLWARVPVGEHVKLAPWYRLQVGETTVLDGPSEPNALRAAVATARYLKRAGKGEFEVQMVEGVLTASRTAAARNSQTGNSTGDG